MRPYHWLLSAGIAVVGMGGSLSWIAGDWAEPGKLVPDQSTVIWRGPEQVSPRPAKVRFTLSNTGGKPVRIIAAEAGCGCTKPTVHPKVVPPGGQGYDPFRDWYMYVPAYTMRFSADEWLSVCASHADGVTGYRWAARCHSGWDWLSAGAIHTAFLTAAPPNSRVPDCGTLESDGVGVYAARSYHPGGVYAALAECEISPTGRPISRYHASPSGIGCQGQSSTRGPRPRPRRHGWKMIRGRLRFPQSPHDCDPGWSRRRLSEAS